MNNVKKMIEAAMLSALFVVASVLVIGGWFFSTLYLDNGVPILIALIYLKCGKRYTILSSLVSLIIIIFVIGNVSIGIFMSQGMVLGFVCGYAIERKTSIFDDLFISAITACLIMISIDITFSGLIGQSFLTEFKEYMDYFKYSEEIKQVIYCIFVATLPLGTMIFTYLVSIILGKKLRILNSNGIKKYIIIKNFRKIGALSYCSKKTMVLTIVYISIVSLVNKFNIVNDSLYIELIITSIEYISLYFLLKDCYSIIGLYTYNKTKSKVSYIAVELLMIFMLVGKFQIAVILMIIANIFIEFKENYRYKQSEKLDKIILRIAA